VIFLVQSYSNQKWNQLMHLIRVTPVFASLGFGLSVCGGTSAADTAQFATHYKQETCNGWSEVQGGVTGSTMSRSDVSQKLDVMKSNADSAALEDSKWQDLDTAVQQLRAAFDNDDTSSMDSYMATISAACQ
jgi:hypothetical protein